MTFAQPAMVGLDSQKYEGFFFEVASTLYSIYIHSINEKEEDIAWSNSDSKRVICKLCLKFSNRKMYVNILKSNWKLILKGERKKGEYFPMTSSSPGSGWGSLVGTKKK